MKKPRSSMFVWAGIKPEHLQGQDSIDFCMRMMDQPKWRCHRAGHLVRTGDGFVRIALVENDQRLTQAMANLDRCLNPRKSKSRREPTAAS